MTIQQTKSGKFVVKSKSGKNLSKPTTKAAAVKRLRQVEHFKRQGSGRKK